MVVFEDIQDLQDWLTPLDYIGFWEAVAPYHLALQDRDHCDGLIASGAVPQDVILAGLKALAQIELAQAFSLKDRVYAPPIPTRH